MAVEIIKRGVLPENKRYEASCLHCRTKFSFLRSDAKYWSSVRNEEGLQIGCPTCAKTVWLEL